MKQSSSYCETCGKQTLHEKQQPNHVLHLLLSVFTLGLWLIVWIILSIAATGKRSRCSVCGAT